jgi:hypothetical protein
LKISRLVAMGVLVLGLLGVMPAAQAKTILFVPADDRPVSLEYSVDTVKAAQLDILTPPAEYLAGRRRAGDPEKLWQWVFDNCKQADALVLSADSLIYGGLVDSRTHDFEQYVLEWRLRHFKKLAEASPTGRVYVFGTIMRTPRTSAGAVEPPYYERYGTDIFTLTALEDKAETSGLSFSEKQELESVTTAVPKEVLADWMKRRDKNYKINLGLIDMDREGRISYLILGRDDTSPFSQSHKEWRELNTVAGSLPANKYASFPGADQLGMVLLAKAYNDLNNHIPVVEVRYASGIGPATIPTYEDQPIGKTINSHIIAAGGIALAKPLKPDLILMVNTPVNGVTDEADRLENISSPTAATRDFVATIKSELAAGRPVAVADIAYANGSDNALMRELENQHILDQVSSYSGWNTASNTLGYAIGQGMMAKNMTNKERKRLLAVRYLDDWAYQANIRRQMGYEVLYPQGGNWMYLDKTEPVMTENTEKQIRLFAGRHLWDMQPEKIHVSFPWDRMFEIRVGIDP